MTTRLRCLALGLLLLAPGLARAQAPVKVGSFPGYGRVVFEFARPPGFAVAEAGGGLVAAGLAFRSRQDYVGGATFFLVVAAVGMVDVVLVPGLIWGRGNPRPVLLLVRMAVALGTPIIAVFAALATGFLIAGIGNSLPPGIIDRFGSFEATGSILLFGWTFGVAGVVVGLGAAVAQLADLGHTPDGRVWSHVVGAVLGLGVILLTEAIFSASAHPRWFLLALPPLLALAALPHNALVLHDAARRGHACRTPRPWSRGPPFAWSCWRWPEPPWP